jgi:hypothetical protein
MNFDLILEGIKKKMGIEEKFDEFLHKRKAGAEKLEAQTRKKGGYSLLTAIHYAAKLKPYTDAIKWENKKGKEKYYKDKAKEIYSKLSNLDNLTQREFQSLMGELEVYGEVYIRATKPNSIKLG